jgi:hypothetical protein
MISLLRTHITFSSPESKYMNDDGVSVGNSFLKFISAKVIIF